MELKNEIYLLSAPWCSNCKALKPMLYDALPDTKEINIDEDPSVPAELGVMSIPTIVDNRDGKSTVITGQGACIEFIHSN